jgi:magnesium chelatase subunit I
VLKTRFRKSRIGLEKTRWTSLSDLTNREYEARLRTIEGLDDLVDAFHRGLSRDEKLFLMEFALHGMAEYSLIGKQSLDRGLQFKDLLGSMFSGPDAEDDDDDVF